MVKSVARDGGYFFNVIMFMFYFIFSTLQVGGLQ